MNYPRLALAAVAGTLIDAVYGFGVYGMLLTPEFAKYPAIFRPTDVQAGYMPGMFGAILVGMAAATAMYAKGYEGGAGVVEGFRFGVLLGVLDVGYVWGVNYAIMNLAGAFAVKMALAGFVEWVIVGVVIGLLYRPGVSRRA